MWDERIGSLRKPNDDDVPDRQRSAQAELGPSVENIRTLKAKIYEGAFRGFSDFPRTIITQTSRFFPNLARARAAKQTMTGTGRVSGTA